MKEGLKALTEGRGKRDWYQVGRELAATMTAEEAQNLVWNLGYLRQGVFDVINSNVGTNRDSIVEKSS